MKRKLIPLLALLACSAMLFGCGVDKTENSAADPAVQSDVESALPEFEDPDGTVGYTLTAYHFSVSEDYTEFDGGGNYNYVFRRDGEKEEDQAYIGVMELVEVHMSAEAFGAGMKTDLEAQGYENVTGEVCEINGMDGYSITCSMSAGGVTISSDMQLVCNGNGSLFMLFTAYSEESKESYQTERDNILKSLVFFGKDGKDGGTHEAKHFTLTYNGDWVATFTDEASIVLERRLSNSECDYITRCKIVGMEDDLTPEDAAKAIYDAYETEPSISELTTTESTVFGHDAWLTSCVNTALAPHHVTMYVYYYKEDGVLYEVTRTYCEDVAAETLADFEKLELK